MKPKEKGVLPDRELAIVNKSPHQLKPNPKNARVHSDKQVDQIEASYRQFGIVNAILIDEFDGIIAGHGRLQAAKRLELKSVPCIVLRGLSERQKIALAIADNKIALNAGWDLDLLKEAIEIASVEIDMTRLGFEIAEQDIILTSANDPGDDAIPGVSDQTVTRLGDVWIAEQHRIGCGDARDAVFLDRVLAGALVFMAFHDVPYNVAIPGHAGGKGRVKHVNFVMAAGEMSDEEFVQFLRDTLGPGVRVSRNGAVHFICIDHRHVEHVIAACSALYGARLNICVWDKSNAGMGSLYRSKHELILVFRVGDQPHRNNVELGRHGRNRTNVWSYPSVNTFGATRRQDLAFHPTVKPVGMVADAILDVTKRGEVMLDSFLGSGTTLIACERTGRICRGIEIDPAYVDVALERFRVMTGVEPILAETNETFAVVARRRAQHSEI